MSMLNVAKDKLFPILVFIFFGCLLFQGPFLAPDSAGYIGASILRSPGYPLFIKLMQFASKNNAEMLLVIVQLLLGLWAVLLTAKTFQVLFNINKHFYIVFVGILLTPYLGKTGNYILTEGLAYPLFLFSMYYLLTGLIYKKNGALIGSFGCIAALVLTRGQFLFMYVIASFGLLYSFQYNKTLLKRLFLTFLLVGTIFGSYMLEKAYHAFYNGRLTHTPSTGLHFIIQPLYVSNIEDAVLFKDSREQDLFLDVRKKMEEQKMSHTFTVGHIDAPHHLYDHFDEIIYNVLYPALSRHGFHDVVDVDNRLKKMAMTLITNHPIAYIKLYVRNLATHLGGYYNTLVMIFAFIASGFYYIRHRDTLSFCAILFSLVAFGNSLLVASVQALHLRYTFYSDVILSCLLIAILYKGFKSGERECKL